MENIISKELLSEVLGNKVTNISNGCTEDELKVSAYFGVVRQSFYINVWELSHKCKNWALSKGYEIVVLSHSIKIYKNSHEVYYDEAINYDVSKFFKACQWILGKK
jgi:hypothetical protein